MERADTTIEAASEHARIQCPAVMKQRLASTSLQMRDEFQGCNRHNIQSHLKQAYSMYLISYTIL